MSINIAIGAKGKHSRRNVEADGINDDHPLGVLDDPVASCPIHDQVEPRPQHQGLPSDEGVPPDRKQADGEPLEVSGRQIHELEQEAERVRSHADARYEQTPEIQSMVALEREKDHAGEFEGVVNRQPGEEAYEDLERQRISFLP